MAGNIGNEYSCSYRFQCALAQPISRRCEEVIALMNDCSFKDAHSLLPLLVESIFGFGSHPGWGIGNLYRHVQSRDYDTFRYLLSPIGPLMRFIYKLNNDVYLKYEFPTQCLPIPVQRTLTGGMVAPIYQNKFQMQSSGKLPAYLLLSPFEFYIFHLTYFLIGSQSQKNRMEWQDQGGCLYVNLVEDYLHYFLPCDGNMASLNQLPMSRSPSPSTPLKTAFPEKSKQSAFRLLKQIPVTKQQSPCTLKDVGQTELWRNEIVAQTFIDLWLNHFGSDSSSSNSDKGFGFLNNGNFDNASTLRMPNNITFDSPFFPSCVHVRLVRMFIKHVHYFSNNASPSPMNAFDEFRKAIIPQLQKKLYCFIKHLFNHWPLDASFKLVLELWLSYIQPWRYVNIRSTSLTSQEKFEEKDRVILSNWQPFVEENIMFYSVFFRKMIKRLLRVDLVCLKNANMLQRICKVFSQLNLCQLIKVAESLLMDSTFRILPTGSVSNRNLLARAASEAGHVAIIRQHISDLERPNYNYTPMFGETSLIRIKLLLREIQLARDRIKLSKSSVTKKNKGWISRFVSSIEAIFLIDYDQSNSKTDEERVAQFLEYSAFQLSQLFQVQLQFEEQSTRAEVNCTPSEPLNFNDSQQSSDFDTSINRCIELLNKSRKPHMEYLGDPDLQMIRSYEITPLVRILNQLSTLINDQFGLEIQHLYDRDDFVGSLSRQVIQSPRLCVSYAHDGLPSPSRETVLPPRICLRPLAKQQNVGFILGAYALPYVCGFNLFTVTLFFAFCAFIYLLFKAFTDPQHQQVKFHT